jgi:hypothetical protein
MGSEKRALEGGVWEGRWDLVEDYFQSKYFLNIITTPIHDRKSCPAQVCSSFVF